MHGPQLSAPGTPVLLVLLPDEFLQTIGLNEGQIFQHAHVVAGAVPLVQRLEPFAGITGTFKAERGFVLALPNRAVLAGLSLAALPAAVAGKPLALIGLTQRAVHPAGGHNWLLQSHFLFSINHTVFSLKHFEKTG